jgi:hypothetical protein
MILSTFVKSDVILFNGPARSGKDTIAEHMFSLLRVNGYAPYLVRLATANKRKTMLRYNLPVDKYKYYDDYKDAVFSEFGVLSPRQAYIETYNMHGLDTQAAVKDVIDAVNVGHTVLVPDCRFVEEAEFIAASVIKSFGDDKKITLATVHRPEHSFKFDIGDYIAKVGRGSSNCLWRDHHILNTGTIAELVTQVRGIVDSAYPSL